MSEAAQAKSKMRIDATRRAYTFGTSPSVFFTLGELPNGEWFFLGVVFAIPCDAVIYSREQW